jgi:ABC-type polysaccharide/polyol phosphate export permease
MKEMIQELIEYRHLIYILAWRDIKIRYKQSVMGYLWAIFIPMVIVGAGIIVKIGFSMISGDPLELSSIASVTVKSLPWSFFIGSIKFATNSLVGNHNLVTKIYFPREVFPISAVLASLVDFTLAAVTLSLILVFAQIGISVYILWVPILLLILVFLVTGLSLFLSCANLFFRDVKYIVDVLVTFAIFFTPVFYEASLFGKWETALLLNPIGSILENINYVVVMHTAPSYPWLAYSAAWGIGTFLLGWIVFHRSEAYFAEYI